MPAASLYGRAILRDLRHVQSVDPKIRETFDNEDWVMEAMQAQGFVRDDDGTFQMPNGETVSMRIPSEHEGEHVLFLELGD